jgi:hypothetical protein
LPLQYPSRPKADLDIGQATLGTDAPSLIDAERLPSTEEAIVSFTNRSSTSLRDLERILTIVCEEAKKYDLFKVSASVTGVRLASNISLL